MTQYKVIASGTDMGTYEADSELVYGSPEHEQLCTGDVRAEVS